MEQTPRPPPPAALERIGRYRIVRPLSKGGMALVYEARRESLAGVSPRVAIKLILPEYTESDTFQGLFVNEARLGASMHHQNLVQIQDFDRDGDRFFLVMEYVDGITLRRSISLCRREGFHVPFGVIADIGRQACDGLHYAHNAVDEAGQHIELVHRDVKPSNLILTPHGVIKLVDFGISKGRRLVEKPGTVKGTWGYMAPEQAAGEDVGPATDVFGLAVVLYELASKRPLFPDKTPEVVRRLLADDHAARTAATLDASYRDIVGPLVRALQRDPAARYNNASDFGRALSALLPDPVAARDEVVRYYGGVEALHKGLPVPEGTLASDGEASSRGPLSNILVREDDSASSIGSSSARERDTAPMGLMVAAVLGVGLFLVLAAGAAVLALIPPTPPIQLADSTVASALSDVQPADDEDAGQAQAPQPVAEPSADEPAGPAAQGSAAEQEPPPVARRTVSAQTERPPPPDTIPVDSSAGSSTDRSVEPQGDGADRVGSGEVAPEPERQVVVVRRSPEPIVEPAPASGSPQGTTEEPTASVPEPPAPVATGPGFLTVGARQAAEVYIDGRFVRRVPLVRYELGSGPHVITIQALDGRRKTVDVVIASGEELRRVWDFDRAEWRP